MERQKSMKKRKATREKYKNKKKSKNKKLATIRIKIAKFSVTSTATTSKTRGQTGEAEHTKYIFVAA